MTNVQYWFIGCWVLALVGSAVALCIEAELNARKRDKK